jgi:Zn-dependent peptidase ImmA (M78 family)
MADIGVNPRVLEWARKEARLSEAEAADALGISAEDLVGYERAGVVTLGVLRGMSAAYQLPIATLAMPEPFAPTKLPKDFRTLDGREAQVTPATAFAIKEARRLQDEMQELLAEEGELSVRYDLPDIPRNTPVAAFASQERARLGLSVESQLAWTNDSAAFRAWRDKIESFGIFVYVLDMPVDDCRGFSLRETPSPVIVISKNEWMGAARCFTLLHEYCHVRINQPGLSDLGGNSTEKYCNDFAAQVLMPEGAVRRVLDLPVRKEVVDWDMNDIRAAARRLHVSQQALALRLETAGYAEVGFFDYVKSMQKGQRRPERKKEKQKGGVAPHVIKLAELGARYTGTVLKALDRGTLNDVEAYRMLDLAPKHFDKLRERVEKRLASDGTASSLY